MSRENLEVGLNPKQNRLKRRSVEKNKMQVVRGNGGGEGKILGGMYFPPGDRLDPDEEDLVDELGISEDDTTFALD